METPMQWPRHSLTRSVSALGVFLFCSAAPVLAQGTGSIRGRVTETVSGRPIAGATVTVTGRTQGAVTSDAGDFLIAGVAAGQTEVTARRIGYTRQTRTVSVTSG